MTLPLRIHIPAVPHTRPTPQWSHCAFTTKARLLPLVLREAYPHAEIIWYGVEGDAVEGVTRHVDLMTSAEWGLYFDAGVTAAHRFVGETANVEHPGYVEFNERLALWWQRMTAHGDLVCFPFGTAHERAWPAAHATGALCVETGIGYPRPFLPFRIYESRAWLHYVAGQTRCEGHDYHFVAPHYYDRREWPTLDTVRDAERGPIVYVGRLVENKGLRVLSACAEAMPDESFVLYGQGDPTPYLRANVTYGGVLERGEVADVFTRAAAALFPTRYIEPFCQAHIEALLCGCPVVASDFGVFPETRDAIRRGAVTTARTLPQFVDALGTARATPAEERVTIANIVHHHYGLRMAGFRYREALEQIRETATARGWFGRYAPAPVAPDPLHSPMSLHQ